MGCYKVLRVLSLAHRASPPPPPRAFGSSFPCPCQFSLSLTHKLLCRYEAIKCRCLAPPPLLLAAAGLRCVLVAEDEDTLAIKKTKSQKRPRAISVDWAGELAMNKRERERERDRERERRRGFKVNGSLFAGGAAADSPKEGATQQHARQEREAEAPRNVKHKGKYNWAKNTKLLLWKRKTFNTAP